jgi:hypothetical protein
VPGDVNSTLAAALVLVKLGVPYAHVESGLRSFDRTMPEEINRIVADEFAEHLFAHSEEAVENLRREGIGAERIHLVGNTMIDTLCRLEPHLSFISPIGHARGVRSRDLPRPRGRVPSSVCRAAARWPSACPFFPVHPRTRARIVAPERYPDVRLLTPIGYLEFLSLEADAAAVLTDSGGVQEETTYLGVPCFTLRTVTERPVTTRLGRNDPRPHRRDSETSAPSTPDPSTGCRLGRACLGTDRRHRRPLARPRVIDLHTHILPGVDDGARTLEDALDMARAFVADGVTTIAATPHVRDDYPTSPDVMERGLDALHQALDGEGIPLTILPGAELAVDGSARTVEPAADLAAAPVTSSSECPTTMARRAVERLLIAGGGILRCSPSGAKRRGAGDADPARTARERWNARPGDRRVTRRPARRPRSRDGALARCDSTRAPRRQ